MVSSPKTRYVSAPYLIRNSIYKTVLASALETLCLILIKMSALTASRHWSILTEQDVCVILRQAPQSTSGSIRPVSDAALKQNISRTIGATLVRLAPSLLTTTTSTSARANATPLQHLTEPRTCASALIMNYITMEPVGPATHKVILRAA